MTAKKSTPMPDVERPKAPPAPPTGPEVRYVREDSLLPGINLPLLNSQEKEYKEKIKYLQNELDSVYASALRFATGVINRSELSTEEKTDLISKLWEK